MTGGPPALISLGGRLRSGKDAFADYLVDAHGYVKLGMSDVLLEHMLIVNPWIRVRVADAWRLRRSFRLPVLPGFHRAQRIVDRVGYVDAKSVQDFREYMQRDGTDAGRLFHGENLWVDVMSRRIGVLLAAGSRVVFTGVRFPNELAMTRELGALPLWVSRPAVEATAAAHPSERSLGADDFTAVVDNSGTLTDLYAVADILALTGTVSLPPSTQMSVPRR